MQHFLSRCKTLDPCPCDIHSVPFVKTPTRVKIFMPGWHQAAYWEWLKEQAAKASWNAQVEQNVTLPHNINSDLIVASSIKEYKLSSWGEWHVLKRFLKRVFWKEGPAGATGYYICDHTWHKDLPIKFEFLTLTWGTVKWSKTKGPYKVTAPDPEESGLTILEEEKVDWSKWDPWTVL